MQGLETSKCRKFAFPDSGGERVFSVLVLLWNWDVCLLRASFCRGSMSLFRNWGNFHNQAKTFLIEQWSLTRSNICWLCKKHLKLTRQLTTPKRDQAAVSTMFTWLVSLNFTVWVTWLRRLDHSWVEVVLVLDAYLLPARWPLCAHSNCHQLYTAGELGAHAAWTNRHPSSCKPSFFTFQCPLSCLILNSKALSVQCRRLKRKSWGQADWFPGESPTPYINRTKISLS